jgi:hypothetical protein
MECCVHLVFMLALCAVLPNVLRLSHAPKPVDEEWPAAPGILPVHQRQRQSRAVVCRSGLSRIPSAGFPGRGTLHMLGMLRSICLHLTRDARFAVNSRPASL